ncbi:MAG TPA: hypothetical protein VMX79_07790 [bacterium]|nr:hypothetical protein [bacterium]
MSALKKLLRGLLYAVLIIVCATGGTVVAYVLVFRPWQLRWGATDEELERAMPGDDLVTNPDLDTTRGVTVEARPEEIWPWLVQIGYRRAGFYSYDRLDNAGVPSAERILPEYQDLKVGDKIPLDRVNRMEVVVLEPPRVMLWNLPGRGFSWAWGLYPLDGRRTRLVTRLHWRYKWRWPVILGYFMIDVGDFIMMRKCMLGIKRRAETAAGPEAGAEE